MRKPLIYYPLSVLMLAGIRDILVITTPEDQSAFQHLLGDGSDFGISLSYALQPSPAGIAQAFLIRDTFIGKDSVCLVLGDNIFYGQGLSPMLEQAVARPTGATVFGYAVKDPKRFGVVEFDQQMRAVSLVKKLQTPLSKLLSIAWGIKLPVWKKLPLTGAGLIFHLWKKPGGVLVKAVMVNTSCALYKTRMRNLKGQVSSVAVAYNHY